MDAPGFARTQQFSPLQTLHLLDFTKANSRPINGLPLKPRMFVSTMHIQLSLAFMGAHPPILLGTMSMIDSIILMVMALVVFGPRRLPKIGRQIGKLMYEFRKASNDFKFQMEEELRNSEEAERRKKEEERQKSLAALAASEQAAVSADPAPPVVTPAFSDSGAATESVPTIMPPSIGETVAAARPGSVISESPEESTSTAPAGTGASSSDSHSAISQSDDRAEALNQHG
jgi:sec-independent protein translocase protein TatB